MAASSKTKTAEDISANGAKGSKPRTYLSQADVPAFSLQEAIRVAEVLRDEYGKQPTKPIDVARALELSPNSGQFRMLTGAALAYGLTDAGPKADRIGLTDLGRRIVSPTAEGDDLQAMREALLKPRVIREFLTNYDSSPIPSPQIANNVLENMDVPASAVQRTYELIIAGAEGLGLLVEIKGKRYVRLDAIPSRPTDSGANGNDEAATVVLTTSAPTIVLPGGEEEGSTYEADQAQPVKPTVPALPKLANNRVFITHGSNKGIVDQIKEILVFGKFEPVVSVERESTAKPVPDKVIDDMRECYAGIVHVGTEKVLLDEKGEEYRILNPNVLIEIGAAMALFGHRFVLLVETGVTLPSNLQGLYEVRYEGNRLDYEATMKLLKAFTEFGSKE